MALDPDATHIPRLEGLSLAIYIVSITCGSISFLVVLLRTWTRYQERTYGWDDALMATGMLFFISEICCACEGAWSGLGQMNANLNDYLMVQATKYLMIWMIQYVCSLLFIKGSICVTLLRIAGPKRSFRIWTFILLGFIVVVFLVTFIGVLMLCRPFEANWNTQLVTEGKATCAGMHVMIFFSYFSTAGSIATDMACAILPGVILWNAQMERRLKFGVALLLSFGSFASISTMIRTPYIRFYLQPENNLIYHVGNIVLWSNIETTIGLVAGSLPSLRRFFKRHVKHSNSDQSKVSQPPVDLVTFGGTGGPPGRSIRKGSFRNPADKGTSVHDRGQGNWSTLGDDSSDKEILRGIGGDYPSSEIELTKTPEHQSVGSAR